MSNQTKIFCLLGLGVMLLTGIIMVDHVGTQAQDAITGAGPAIATSLDALSDTNQRPGLVGRNLASASDLAPRTQPTRLVNMGSMTAIEPKPETQGIQQGVPLAGPQPTTATGPAPLAGPAPIASPAPIVPPVQTPPATRTYAVQKGDQLAIIAQKTLGSARRWREILAANPKALPQGEKTVMRIGLVLNIPGAAPVAADKPAPIAAPIATADTAKPAPAAARTYTVQKGDLLSTVAQKTLGSSKRVKEIVAANRKALPQGEKTVLKVGTVLSIPAKAQ